MSNQTFFPERGQLFWYVRDTIRNKLPDLEIVSDKFDPKNKLHQELLKAENCYHTREEAINSLL